MENPVRVEMWAVKCSKCRKKVIGIKRICGATQYLALDTEGGVVICPWEAPDVLAARPEEIIAICWECVAEERRTYSYTLRLVESPDIAMTESQKEVCLHGPDS